MLAQLGLTVALKGLDKVGLTLAKQRKSETIVPKSLHRRASSVFQIKHLVGGPCGELSVQNSLKLRVGVLHR